MVEVNGRQIETPELDKMSKVTELSQAIGEYLDTQSEQGYSSMKWTVQDEEVVCPGTMWNECDNGLQVRSTSYVHGDDAEGDGKKYTSAYKCEKCKGTGLTWLHWEGWVSDPRRIEDRLAEHFGIDLQKAEKERRAMLAAARERQRHE